MTTIKKVYYCECCGYNSRLKKDFNKHLVTRKHCINTENDTKDVVVERETKKKEIVIKYTRIIRVYGNTNENVV